MVLAFEGFFNVFERGFDFFFLCSVNLVAVFRQALLHAVGHGVSGVAGLHEFQFLFVFGGIEFGVFHHLRNLGFVQTGVGFDGDFVFLACAFVFGAHMQDAVGVDVKAHLNLWRAAW